MSSMGGTEKLNTHMEQTETLVQHIQMSEDLQHLLACEWLSIGVNQDGMQARSVWTTVPTSSHEGLTWARLG